MALYYVKSGGTATGDGGRYATKQTGSFAGLGASGYYDNISDAFSVPTTLPTNGDQILVSDAHSHTYAGTGTYLDYNVADDATTVALAVISVSDTAIDTFSKATSVQEAASAGGDILLTGSNGDDSKLVFHGLWLETDDDITSSGQDSAYEFFHSTLRSNAAGDSAIRFGNTYFYDCEIKADGSTSSNWFAQSSVAFFKRCSFTTDQASKTSDIFQAVPTGCNVYAEDCDFSQSKAVALFTPSSVDKEINLTLINCALPIEMTTFVDATPVIGQGFGVLIVGSASTSAAAEYQYYYFKNNHYIEDDTAIYRDGSTAFGESNQKVSYKCVTSSNCDPVRPFVFELPSRYAELSTASEDVIKLYLLSSDSGLTDADVRVEVSYPDGTNKHIRNFAENAALDPLRAGSALATNTEAWTGRTTESRYEIDIDTSGDAGADCVPTIRVYVTKPSTTIYFCSTIGLS